MKDSIEVELNRAALKEASDGHLTMMKKISSGHLMLTESEKNEHVGYGAYRMYYPYSDFAWHVVKATESYIYNHPFFEAVEATYISVIVDYILSTKSKKKDRSPGSNVELLLKELPSYVDIFQQNGIMYIESMIRKIRVNALHPRNYRKSIIEEVEGVASDDMSIHVFKKVIEMLLLIDRTEIKEELRRVETVMQLVKKNKRGIFDSIKVNSGKDNSNVYYMMTNSEKGAYEEYNSKL